MGRAWWRQLLLSLAALAAACAAWGGHTQLGGHLKLQYTHTDYRADDLAAVFGHDPSRDTQADFRLKAEHRRGPWEFVAHYEWLALGGDTLEVRRALAALGLLIGDTATGLPDDRRRLFDLTDRITDRPRRAMVQRLDRFSVGYVAPRWALRFGRQVVSWGNGLVFHPLDFVNPFSPIAVDKDYKTGDDMLYGQWLQADGSEVQAILLPRRDPATRDLESDQGTYALKWRWRRGGVDVDLLAARHFGEDLAGVGVVRSVGGAVWRFDAAYTNLDDGGGALALVTNLDYSWNAWGKNFYGYAEYFRSGVGETDRSRYLQPNAALVARLARGELFTRARDYAALGVQAELTPLLHLYVHLIQNLDDGSRIVQLRGVYDWQQDLLLTAGLDLPSGERGTEFGGLAVPGTDAYGHGGRSVYLRVAYYF